MTALLSWFKREVNRRRFDRKQAPYPATYTVGGGPARPAIGIDLSGGGLCFLTQDAIPDEEIDVQAKLHDRTIRLRATPAWQDKVLYQGREVHRFGMRLTGIAADDWDAIIRWTTGLPVVEINKALDDLSILRLAPDDAARLMPKKMQDVMHGMLVRKGRLAPLDPHLTPLVQYVYSGVARVDGHVLHRLTVQSRVVGPDGTKTYDSKFVYDEAAGKVQLLD